MIRRRPFALVGVFLGSIFLATGAVAYACTNLATLNLSSGTGKPGDTITVTGSSFRMPSGVTTGVQIRWNALDGPVLAEATPDRVGNISATFTVPDAAPDSYVVIAVLHDARGNDTSGTPARAQFQILGGAGRPVAATASGPVTAAGGGEGSSAAPIALLFVLGALGLGLFGAGFAAVARQARRSAAPVPAPVRRD
ncbi:MAG: hypothetical protein M3314_10400 [Actinomycetota bacterium]|nr:hypothetical protein [Actinomycetota bacterium]